MTVSINFHDFYQSLYNWSFSNLTGPDLLRTITDISRASHSQRAGSTLLYGMQGDESGGGIQKDLLQFTPGHFGLFIPLILLVWCAAEKLLPLEKDGWEKKQKIQTFSFF